MVKELKKIEAYKILEERFSRTYNLYDEDENFREFYYNAEKREDEDYITFTFKERDSKWHPCDPISVIYDKNHFTTMINFVGYNCRGNITFVNGDRLDIDSLLSADAKEIFNRLYYCGEFSRFTPLFNKKIQLDYVESNLGILKDFGYISEDDIGEIMYKFRRECGDVEEYEEVLKQYVDIDNVEEFLHDVNVDVIYFSCILKEIKRRFY